MIVRAFSAAQDSPSLLSCCRRLAVLPPRELMQSPRSCSCPCPCARALCKRSTRVEVRQEAFLLTRKVAVACVRACMHAWRACARACGLICCPVVWALAACATASAWQELPEAVLDMMMSKNIDRALKASGLSFPSMFAARLLLESLLLLPHPPPDTQRGALWCALACSGVHACWPWSQASRHGTLPQLHHKPAPPAQARRLAIGDEETNDGRELGWSWRRRAALAGDQRMLADMSSRVLRSWACVQGTLEAGACWRELLVLLLLMRYLLVMRQPAGGRTPPFGLPLPLLWLQCFFSIRRPCCRSKPPPASPHLSSLFRRLSHFPLLVSCQIRGLASSVCRSTMDSFEPCSHGRRAGSAWRLPAPLPSIPVRCLPLLLLQPSLGIWRVRHAARRQLQRLRPACLKAFFVMLLCSAAASSNPPSKDMSLTPVIDVFIFAQMRNAWCGAGTSIGTGKPERSTLDARLWMRAGAGILNTLLTFIVALVFLQVPLSRAASHSSPSCSVCDNGS